MLGPVVTLPGAPAHGCPTVVVCVSLRARALVPTSGTRVPTGHATLCMSRHGHELPVRPPGVLDKYRAGATRRQHERAGREWMELAKAALKAVFHRGVFTKNCLCFALEHQENA